MTAAGTDQLVDRANRYLERGEAVVLATIVATTGSTYRKAGARVLLAAGGDTVGMLGGGSFERELHEHAAELFGSGDTRLLEFDMPSARDADPGGQFQRDGTARILLQGQATTDPDNTLARMAGILATGTPAVLVTVVESHGIELPRGTSFRAGDCPVTGPLGEEIRATANAAREGAAMLVHHLHDGLELELFYDLVRAPLHLLLAGAGADAEPVARIADVLGWQVTVVDARPALCNAERFPPATRVLYVTAAELGQQVPLERVDAAVLLTRSFDEDSRFIVPIARSAIPFIGILGSKRRCARLLDVLGDTAAATAPRVHGPVGIDIGASSPEEIALAIVAQVQSTWRPRPAPVIEGTTGSGMGEGLAPLPWAVVLAAGASSRYGGFKQLLEFGGESLLRRVVRLAMELVGNRVVVVHGPKPTKCQRELSGFDVTNVVNPHWESGMALSLKTGIRALPAEAPAALVLLCDQPLVRAEQVEQLVSEWRRAPAHMVAAAYGGTTGVPAIFPRQYFDELLTLTGDAGAKAVLRAHGERVIGIELPEAAFDIDTQEDYARLLTLPGSG